MHQAFWQHTELEVIWWAGDDIHIKRGVTLAKLSEVVNRCSSRVHWVGYLKVKSQPRWGSHLLAITRESAKPLQEALELMERAMGENASGVQHLRGLDTVIWQLSQPAQHGVPLVLPAAWSMAGQRKHTLQRRG